MLVKLRYRKKPPKRPRSNFNSLRNLRLGMIENKEKIGAKWAGMDDARAESRILGKSSGSSSKGKEPKKKKRKKSRRSRKKDEDPLGDIELEESEIDDFSDSLGSTDFDSIEEGSDSDIELNFEDGKEKKKKGSSYRGDSSDDESESWDDEGSSDGRDSFSDDSDSESESDSDSDSDSEGEDLPIDEVLKGFAVVKRKYKVKVPEFNEFSDPRTANSALRRIKFQCSLDSNVLWYKRYFIYSSALLEYVLVQFAHLDIQEMTKYHLSQLDVYDELIVELGERRYTSIIGSLPIEVRLIGLFVFNSIIYYIGKNFFPAFLGMSLDDIMSVLEKTQKGFSFAGQVPSSPPQDVRPRGQMRPPTLSVSDIQ